MVHKHMLIRRAVTGDPTYLKSLHVHIKKNRDSDIDTCFSLIHLLDPTVIPSTGTFDSFEKAFKDRMERVNLTLNIFFSVFDSIPAEDVSSKQALTTFFGKHLNDIFRWVMLFHSEGMFLPTCALTIIMLQSLDQNLLPRIMTSCRLLELILLIWMRKDRFGRYMVAATHRICPILDMVQGFVIHEPRKALFLQLHEDKPRKMREIAHVVRVRILELKQRYLEGEIQRKFALEQIIKILEVSSVILSRYNRWLAFLVPKDSPNFLCVVVEVLGTISQAATEESYLAALARALRYVCRLVLRAGLNMCPLLMKLLTVLDRGLLTLIIQCLLYLPPANTSRMCAADLFQEISAYAIFSEITRFFSKDGILAAPADLRRIKEVPVGDQECWTVVRVFVAQAVQTFNRRKGQILTTKECDGLGHTHHQEVADSDVRQCSRCHSVIYCSPECQRQDWEQLHHHECPTQSSNYTLHRFEGWISPVNRAWCLVTVEGIVNAHMSTFDMVRLKKGITAPLQPCILVINGLTLPTQANVTQIPSYRKRNHDLPDASLSKRIDAYLSQFLQMQGTIWLVEVLFPYGGATIHYLIRLTKDEDGCLHAISAIPRIWFVLARCCFQKYILIFLVVIVPTAVLSTASMMDTTGPASKGNFSAALDVGLICWYYNVNS
ncbi:hypothetical protein EST38_g12382 [Candolleomyces aberdarensis]|uniref:MYND-type domain-containing protein n=1 Tax=Candolleomyces aberdarensis TaxID=2316362 RepID=A0A4Q2D4S4_9AGAR|nr:hypothetical protein EST38_g12382 [Candolleomyces aberdarensis]